MTREGKISDEVLAWAVRTSDPDFSAWDEFTQWLESSPTHARAYDEAMLAIGDGVHELQSQGGPIQQADGATARRPWLASAMAACLAVVAAVWVWQPWNGQEIYETRAGQDRRVELADGSTVTLAGGSRLVVDDDEARLVGLEKGRALFEVEHDERDPFRVKVAGATLVDAGTIFEVAIARSRVRVGVSEGEVIFNPRSANARIVPGHVLTFRENGSHLVEDLPIEQVGEWRQGRLTFRNAPLSEVIDDIATATGLRYRLEPSGQTSPISGSVQLDAIRNDPASLGAMLGVDIRRAGDEWVIGS